MSDEEKDLQELFDHTAATPSHDQLDMMARRAALKPERRTKRRVEPQWLIALAAAAIGLPLGVIVVSLAFHQQTPRQDRVGDVRPGPSKTVYVDADPSTLAPAPLPTEQPNVEVALIDDEDTDDPVEGIHALSPDSASAAQIAALEEFLDEPDRAD